MDKYDKRIIELLKESPRGLTYTQLKNKTKFSSITIAHRCEILALLKRIEQERVGKAVKNYYKDNKVNL